MGNFINKVMGRVFEFPIKLHPICFLRQEEYSSTGELILPSPIMIKQELEYEKLLQNFTENLKAKKKKQKILIENHQMSTLKDILEAFPDWNDMTISVLHHLYLLFADAKSAMLSFHDFCAILEYLGDRNALDVRAKKFDKADSDKDGFILFREFLSALYNFNHSKKGGLQGLAALCKEAAERSRTISSLTLGEHELEKTTHKTGISVIINERGLTGTSTVPDKDFSHSKIFKCSHTRPQNLNLKYKS